MDVVKAADDLAARMAQQLRVRGTGLEEVAAKAGRKLPKHLHAEVDVLVDALHLVEHPKLAPRVDERRLRKADRKIRKFLEKQDPAKERIGEILDRLAAVAFVVFTIALAVFLVLLWRGYFDRV